jgi:hypothetical protein
MKQTLTLIIILLVVFQSGYCQKTEKKGNQKYQQSHDIYIQKYKANKTVAWVMLGSGIAMTVAGLGINMEGGVLDGDSTNNNKGLWLSYLGGATTIVSVPLFFSAGKNKRKARMSLQSETVGYSTFEKNRYIAISYAINF